MIWNYIVDNEYPAQFEEVIICSSIGKIKAATYLGNKKWSTFYDVVCWTHFPDAPIKFNDKSESAESEPEKRGRPKKS
jgi:hypothetical protein